MSAKSSAKPAAKSGAGSLTLASPFKLPCGVEMPNRLVKAAMTEGLGDTYNRATPQHENLYRMWGEGGCGMLLTGNVQVDRRFLERAGNIAIDGEQSEEALEGLRRMAAAAKKGGAQIWMQISHPGRQCPAAVHKEPVAPSAVRLPMPKSLFAPPRALREEEIEDIITRFIHAARVAKETGYDGVQLHSAHGYLLSEFLSPLVNRREDKWGGSLENRARLMLEIIRGWRKELGADFPISVKLNSADFQRGGFVEEESREVAQMLEKEGIDLLEISGGSYERTAMMGSETSDAAEQRRASTVAREAYFLEYAAEMRKAVKTPLMVTGGFRTAEGMKAALASGMLDVIGLGRPLCVDPAIAGKIIRGEVAETSRHEDQLALLPGRFLGPNSPIPLLRILNALALIGWNYYQLLLMGDGKMPDPSIGLFSGWRRNSRFEARVAATRIPPT